MTPLQIIGVFLAASSVGIGLLCVLAEFFSADDPEDGKLPDHITDRARGFSLSAQRVSPGPAYIGLGDDTYPASLLTFRERI